MTVVVAHARLGRGVSQEPFSQSVSLREKFTVAGFHRKRERSASATVVGEREEETSWGGNGRSRARLEWKISNVIRIF